MLKKRIIPLLLLMNDRLVKTVNFDKFKDENSAKRFDSLDFVIMDVPGTDLPWLDKSL